MPTQTELKRYQALLDLARSLGRVMEINTLLDEILRRSQEVLHVEACSIFLPDKKTGELIINSARGDKAPMLFATRIPKGEGIAGHVYETCKTLVIRDVQNDPRHYAGVDKKTGFETRSLITVPLLNGEECLGVMQAINPAGRDLFDKKDEDICEAFSGLIVSALLRIEAQKHELDQIKAKQEMELASEIQKSFLPPAFARFEPCRLRMEYLPAQRIGGDFCFVYPCCMKSQRFLIGLGDVSGKGVPAALNMARATATIKAMVPKLINDLGGWVTELNRQLIADLHGGRFIGITFLFVDGHAGIIQICCAGQYAPLHFNGKSWRKPATAPQLPLGILDSFQYNAQAHPLERGDCWLLFSDGITEARNAEGQDYTEENFFQNLPTNMAPQEMFAQITQHWKNFTGSAPQHDDATLMMLDWRGLPPLHQLEQTCDPSTLCHCREFAEAWARHAGFDDVTAGQIALGCDEAITNIYRHAYHNKPGPITFSGSIRDNQLVFEIQDQGTPVDPAKIKGRSLDDLRPGGLGTVLLKEIFNDIAYHPTEHGTRLVLKKNVPEEIPPS